MKTGPVIFIYLAIVAALVLGTWSCSGDGIGLDWDGRISPEIIRPDPDSAKADSIFHLIQTTVFTPICTQCHIGPNAPYGLLLDTSHSRTIFGRASIGKPGMVLIIPGDPDNSYLLWKLEGHENINGYRMPYMGIPMTEAQIKMFISWIYSL